ncbi:BTAD domain-containing putative transcriptional regulator [Streptosporangium sp. OZ121]|uniref:BTAD domain-containing putative transcriptional regulator n=1 Tax=Streptosporangium sp. OZ121 TaxID=3444183 RepID=UPI003F7A8AF6
MSGAADRPEAGDRIRVRALGSLELSRANPGLDAGEKPLLRSGNLRRLLATLLVHVGSVVSADTLAEIVWGDTQPVRVEAALQTVMSRLRMQLRSAGLNEVLLTRQPGYMLKLDSDVFDVTHFRDLAERAHAIVESDPRRAADLLDTALGLWRGRAYAEFGDDEFAVAEVAGLAEARLVALEDRAEAALSLGAPNEAVALLERVIAEAPMRERPQGQLMLALYRIGRQADALAVYRRYRTLISDELGLRPLSGLRELESRILQHDSSLMPRSSAHHGERNGGEEEARSGDQTKRPLVSGLSAARSPLVGRDQVLHQVMKRLSSSRVLTLTGPGGVGKTRLMLAAAEASEADPARFPDGVWLVELALLQRPVSLASAVLTALGVQIVGTVTPQERLIGYLQTRRALLVLDNCEHLVDDVADLVQSIVGSCPELSVLATSRVPLGIESEQINPVPPLDVPTDAVRLFVERATAVAPAFDPTGPTLEVLTELCRRLDGMPLAIELAAGRMRYMTPAEIVARMPDGFRLMRNPYRRAVERHQTLQTVIDWSYQLLEPGDQELFERLSAFAGAFAADDAAAVCGLDVPAVVERIGDLVDKSMVVATADRTWQVTSYSLLETLRSFGRDRLEERGNAQETFRAHAEHLRVSLDRGPRLLHTGECGRWMTAIAQRIDDIRVAHTWALNNDLTLDLGLMVGLADWMELQMPGEMAGWAENAAERWIAEGHPADRPLAALSLGMAASGAQYRTDHRLMESLTERSWELLNPDDPLRRFAGVGLLGHRLASGDLDGVNRLSRDVLNWSLQAGDRLRAGYAQVCGILGVAYGGDLVAAERAAEDFSRLNRSGVFGGWGAYLLGETLLDREPERAAGLLERAHEQAIACQDCVLMGAALSSLASIRLRYGDPLEAVPLYREVIEHWHRIGNWVQQWTSVRGAIFLLAELGDLRSAMTLLTAMRRQEGAGPAFGQDAQRVRAMESLFTRALDLEERQRLTARGMTMTDAEILRLTLDRLTALEPASRDRTEA